MIASPLSNTTLTGLLLASLTFLYSCSTPNGEKKYRIGFAQCTGTENWKRATREGMQRELSLHPGTELIYRSANVPVAEIETELRRHTKVADVALIGIPDPAADERVCAVVTAAGDTPPTLAELRDHLSDAGVSSWCWPERLEVLDALPRTPLGKVRKVDLRKRYPSM